MGRRRKTKGETMAQVKIYVACHKTAPVPEHPFLVPLQVGAALAGERFPGMIQDDTGDNISGRNRSYCELTGLYWAWKNDCAQYQGLFHYRRYLSFASADFRRAGSGPWGRPYRVLRGPDHRTLEKNGYFSQGLWDSLRQYDVIAPVPEEMHITVARHYAQAPHHHGRDLALVCSVLQGGRPALYQAAQQYLSGTAHFFGNLCLMKRELFCGYCQWLFSVLEEYDRKKDVTGYTAQALRVDGYLAERLLGAYLLYLKREGASLAFLPRLHFAGMEAPGPYYKKRAEMILLPPGTARRSAAKRLLRKHL